MDAFALVLLALERLLANLFMIDFDLLNILPLRVDLPNPDPYLLNAPSDPLFLPRCDFAVLSSDGVPPPWLIGFSPSDLGAPLASALLVSPGEKREESEERLNGSRREKAVER
eukprot:273987-Amorphochlora_amoeboformis.AAC.1